MIYLSLFTDLNREEWDALSEPKKKEIRAKHYVENEVFMDAEWVLAYKEWFENGQIGPEPQPKFDYMETQFNGCDMYNAFMKGIEFGKDLANKCYSKQKISNDNRRKGS